MREREQRALRAVSTAGLLQAEPDALRPLLTAVTGAVPAPAPPDVHALLADAQGRRLLVIGVVALVVALLAAARWLL